jgi:hypothetical protein
MASTKEATMSKTAIASPEPDDNKPELTANVPDEASPSPTTPVDEVAAHSAKQGGYDWESMILPDNGAGDIRTTEVPGVPRLKRPPNTQFFRTRKELSGVIYTLDTEYDGERTVYLVAPNVAAQLPDESAIKPKRAVTCITREGGLHVWLISSGGTDTWTQSANKATDLAQSKWVRATSSRSLGEYRCVTAEAIQEEPKWPEETFLQTLSRAFDGRVIDTLNHSIIKQLKGLE